jgi:hypothetical protein
VRFSAAKSAHAVLSACETPLAQHALSPANALDAISVAAATKAILVILIMMSAQIAVLSKVFKLFQDNEK